MGTLRWQVLMMLLLLCGVGGQSASAGPIGNAEEGVLVLGVLWGDHLEARATKAVVQRLGRMGEEVVDSRWVLTPAEQRCREAECLVRVGQRHGAGRLLFGDVTQGGSRTYGVQMWLFDLKTRQSQEEEQGCEDCDRTALIAAVTAAAGRLLEHAAAARQTGPVATVIPDAPGFSATVAMSNAGLVPDAELNQRGAKRRPFYKRGWFWGVVGGVVVGAVVAGITVAVTSEHQRPPPSGPYKEIF